MQRNDLVAHVEFTTVKSILLIYNTVQEQFDQMKFINAVDSVLATLTLTSPIGVNYQAACSFKVLQYQLAGVFASNLEFLANLLGQQGASVKWPCIFCLVNLEKLGDTCQLGDNVPRFKKREGITLIQKRFAVYKREYLELDVNQRTKAKREKVTQKLLYSIGSAPLLDSCLMP